MRYDTQRYDTEQDFEGRPRMDVEDAPTEATEAPPRTADVPPETSDVEEVEEAEPAPAATPVAEEETEPAPAATPVAEEEAEPAPAATPVAEEEAGALWPPDAVQDFQQRWRDVQWRFVDDPRAAADEAQALVTEALDRFSTSVASRKGELDGWRDTDDADTERMRMVVRRYRDLLDRLVGV